MKKLFFYIVVIFFATASVCAETLPRSYSGTYFNESVITGQPKLLSIYSVLPEGFYTETYAAGWFQKLGGFDIGTGLAQGEYLQLYADISKSYTISKKEEFHWYVHAKTPFPTLLPREKNPAFDTVDVVWGIAHSWRILPELFFSQKFETLFNPNTFSYDGMYSTYAAGITYEKDRLSIGLNFLLEKQFPKRRYSEANTRNTTSFSVSWRFCGIFKACKK